MDNPNKLKEIRTRFGLRQKDIAERLHTTQQTVARWETGVTAIPTPHLKDLAVLFSCSIDQILGINPRGDQSGPQRVTAVENPVPWGTLKVRLGHRVQADQIGENDENGAKNENAYPIDEHTREELRKTLHGEAGLTKIKGWLEFLAMDNRLIFLNPTFVTRLQCVSDDVDKMPYWASRMAYTDLTDGIPANELGRIVREERDEIIRQLTGLSDSVEPTDQHAKQAVMEMKSVKVIYANGWEEKFLLNDDTAISLYFLSQEIDTVGPNTFISVGEHEDLRVSINCSSIAAIEVPWGAYSAFLDRDD
jgi:transcriptional regulator with XRE-family HTH domain